MINLIGNKITDLLDIYVNDKRCEGAYADGDLTLGYNYYSNLSVSSKILGSIEIKDFLPFESIKLNGFFQWFDFKDFVEVTKTTSVKNEINASLIITIVFEPDFDKWQRKYKFPEYCALFNSLWGLNRRKPENLKIETAETTKLILSFRTPLSNKSIKKSVSFYEKLLRETHEQTVERLTTKYNEPDISLPFIFPEQIKVSCEQYLLYFAQFLQDLGINATSNIKEESGKVLFSVTPTDDVEALDKIREALAVYLKLPSSPIVYDDSFAAMRLKQQVDNLQHAQRMTEMEVRSSQYALRLANQTIEHQDKIIQQKDTTIEQQNKIIERITDQAIMINSAENKEELEEIFDGVKV